MFFGSGSANDEAHLRRAIDAYEVACRSNGIELPGFLEAIRRALTRLDTPEFGDDVVDAEDGLMSSLLLYTKEDAARLMRISPRQVDRLIKDGALPAVRLGRARRIVASDLQEYVQTLSAKGTADG